MAQMMFSPAVVRSMMESCAVKDEDVKTSQQPNGIVAAKAIKAIKSWDCS